MKRLINSFCSKHPGFGLQHLIKYITAANVIMWVINMISPRFLSYMTFNPSYIMHGQIWRLISFAFIPPSTGLLAIIAFYFYYFIGSTLEARWGTVRFNIYFLSGILLTVLYGLFIYFVFGMTVNLNAQFIYLSMFFSFAAMFPDTQVLLFFIIPVKMKWLGIIDAIFFAASILSTPFPASLLPLIAVLNFFIFCGDDLLYLLGFTKSRSASTINFKKTAKKIRKEQAGNLYRHKCCVCGRTDSDYPGLEFRFCSKCSGYHCFCIDHINNHIHFTE